jgi:hypothetical protein
MVKLPHHNASNMTSMSANSKHGMNFIKGSGMGSVLLRSGGPGGASSYMDMDDYIATTGINPYARASAPQGKGLASSITNKLSKLNIAPPTTSQRKNIVMSM